MKKAIIALLIMGALGLGFSQEVYACSKTSGCAATGESVSCGYVQGHSAGAHLVTEPNGYSSYCEVTEVSGTHTIKCSGCNATLRTEYRVCSVIHSNVHCFSQYDKCQY